MAKINDLELATSNECKQASPGDLGAVVSDGKLLIHPSTLDSFQSMNVDARTALEFVAHLQLYSEAYSKGLGWAVDDFKAAYDKLADQLQGHIDDNYLRPSDSPTKRAYGALNPNLLKSN